MLYIHKEPLSISIFFCSPGKLLPIYWADHEKTMVCPTQLTNYNKVLITGEIGLKSNFVILPENSEDFVKVVLVS